MLYAQIINAVMLGCTYSLVAIGFSLFFGVLDTVVFCTGDVAIFSSFSVVLLVQITALYALLIGLFNPFFSILITVLLAAVITAALMVIMYQLVIKPFENKSSLMPLLSTIAAGIALRELIGIFFPQGRNPRSFPELLSMERIFEALPGISWRNGIIILATILIVALLHWFINKTKIGLSIQAVSQNREAATMVGINRNLVIYVTFIVGGLILGFSGFLIGSYYSVIRFDLGASFGLKGFSAAVVGGLGNLYGAIVGSMLIAFAEVFVSAYIPGGTAYAGIAAFVLVLLFILFKPEGVLGSRSIEKV
ncbi:MAG TPA: branched-chain amino acid ABC transporter permease [Sediminispirochaeta sp.]|nr:branched-chain amino acid ABC transporter permease [Sediminispirochaeta sp.]